MKIITYAMNRLNKINRDKKYNRLWNSLDNNVKLDLMLQTIDRVNEEIGA